MWTPSEMLFIIKLIICVQGINAYQRNEEKVASQKNDQVITSNIPSLQLQNNIGALGDTSNNLGISTVDESISGPSPTDSFSSQISNIVSSIQDSFQAVSQGTDSQNGVQGDLSALNSNTGQSSLASVGLNQFSNQFGQLQGSGTGENAFAHHANFHWGNNGQRFPFSSGLNYGNGNLLTGGGITNQFAGNSFLQMQQANRMNKLPRGEYGGIGRRNNNRQSANNIQAGFPQNRFAASEGQFQTIGQQFGANRLSNNFTPLRRYGSNQQNQHISSIQNAMASRLGGQFNTQNGVQRRFQNPFQQNMGMQGFVSQSQNEQSNRRGKYGGRKNIVNNPRGGFGQNMNNIFGGQRNRMQTTTPTPVLQSNSLVQKLLSAITGSGSQQNGGLPGLPPQIPPPTAIRPSPQPQGMGGGMMGIQQAMAANGFIQNRFPGPVSTPASVQRQVPNIQSVNVVPQGFIIDMQGQRQMANVLPTQIQQQPVQQIMRLPTAQRVPSSKLDVISMIMQIVNGQSNRSPTFPPTVNGQLNFQMMAPVTTPSTQQSQQTGAGGLSQMMGIMINKFGQRVSVQQPFAPSQIPGTQRQNVFGSVNVPPSPSPMQFGNTAPVQIQQRPMYATPRGTVSQDSAGPSANLPGNQGRLVQTNAGTLPNTQNLLIEKLRNLLNPGTQVQSPPQQQEIPRVSPLNDILNGQQRIVGGVIQTQGTQAQVLQQSHVYGINRRPHQSHGGSPAREIPASRFDAQFGSQRPQQMQMNIPSVQNFNLQQPMSVPQMNQIPGIVSPVKFNKVGSIY